MTASHDASPICMGHTAANAGPGTSNFPNCKPKPKMHHLCKNMQKAVQGTASCILALIRLGGNMVSVTAPVPEGSFTCIQITTRPALRLECTWQSCHTHLCRAVQCPLTTSAPWATTTSDDPARLFSILGHCYCCHGWPASSPTSI